MNFITGLPLSTNEKGDNYDAIFVIINQLTKIVNYKRVKTMINAVSLAKVIIDVVIKYHNFFKSIVCD